VPFAIRWPAQLAKGVVEARPVSALDIVPTVLAAAKSASAGDHFDGVDLLPYLVGKKRGVAPHGALFWRLTPWYAVRDGRWKQLQDFQRKHPQLYDLSADLGETNDLSAKRPEMVDSLQRSYLAWSKDMMPPKIGLNRKRTTKNSSFRIWLRKLRSKFS
jgi:arylsulfatase A-like enzyme